MKLKYVTPLPFLFTCFTRSLSACTSGVTNHFQGHVVTLEITSGQVYRGKLLEGNVCLLLQNISDTCKYIVSC